MLFIVILQTFENNLIKKGYKMEFKISEAIFGTRPAVEKPSLKFLETIKEDGLREIISKHYDLLRQSSIKDLFPQDDEEFEQAKINSADFFIQICGGPDYFNQHRGNPMMVKRHAPFKITPKARRVWLECYIEILKDLDIPEDLKKSFWNYLDIFSMWMINSPED